MIVIVFIAIVVIAGLLVVFTTPRCYLNGKEVFKG